MPRGLRRVPRLNPRLVFALARDVRASTAQANAVRLVPRLVASDTAGENAQVPWRIQRCQVLLPYKGPGPGLGTQPPSELRISKSTLTSG